MSRYARRRKSSDGTIGERLSEYEFVRRGWHMVRTQPATKMIWRDGKPIVIYCGTGGVTDYTGYERVECGCGDVYQCYRVCEVKECKGDTMPASRLTRKQRWWMAGLPLGCAWVMVVWMDGGPVAEMFPFVESGSYRRTK